jgi:hypothetical protein
MEEINDVQEKHLNKSMRAAQDVLLGTRLKNLQEQDSYTYAGVRSQPTITDNGDGSLTIGEGTYSIYPDSSGSSLIEVHVVPGNTFVLDDSISTYVYISMSTGSPVLSATTNFDTIPGTKYISVIPIVTAYRYGNLINIIDWDQDGLALSEKLLYRTVSTDRFHRTNGLILGEYDTRSIFVTSGSVWYGANQLNMESFYSGSSLNYMYLTARDSSGIWTGSLVTQYDNTHYQGASGLVTLTNTQRYCVNWVFRVVSNFKKFVVIVLGTDDYKLDEALASTLPVSLPNIVMTQSILVGRIIIQKSANVATEIDSAFDIGFSPTSLDHNSLFGLDGGDFALNEYYHLTQDNYNKISGSSYEAIFGDAINYTAFEADGTMIMSGSATVWDDIFFPLTTAKQGQTDKPAFDANEVAYLFPQADTSAVMYIIAQFPHSWKIGSRIYPHVHWKQTQSGSVVYKIDYKWTSLGSQVSNSFTTYTMSSPEYLYTSGSLNQINTNTVGISGSSISGVSSIMLIKLYRDDNTYTGNATTYQFDIHILKDSLGSRTEGAK